MENHNIITWASFLVLIVGAIWTGYHPTVPFTALVTGLLGLSGASHVSNYLGDTASANPTQAVIPSIPIKKQPIED